MAQSEIEREIAAATRVKIGRADTREEYLKKMLVVLQQVPDDVFNGLSGEAQDWNNANVNQDGSLAEVPTEFPDYVAEEEPEPEAAPARSRRATTEPEEPEQPEPDGPATTEETATMPAPTPARRGRPPAASAPTSARRGRPPAAAPTVDRGAVVRRGRPPAAAPAAPARRGRPPAAPVQAPVANRGRPAAAAPAARGRAPAAAPKARTGVGRGRGLQVGKSNGGGSLDDIRKLVIRNPHITEVAIYERLHPKYPDLKMSTISTCRASVRSVMRLQPENAHHFTA